MICLSESNRLSTFRAIPLNILKNITFLSNPIFVLMVFASFSDYYAAFHMAAVLALVPHAESLYFPCFDVVAVLSSCLKR